MTTAFTYEKLHGEALLPSNPLRPRAFGGLGAEGWKEGIPNTKGNWRPLLPVDESGCVMLQDRQLSVWSIDLSFKRKGLRRR